MNKSTLRSIHTDYVRNNIDVAPAEYRYVIDKLIAEIERLQAVIVVNKVRISK